MELNNMMQMKIVDIVKNLRDMIGMINLENLMLLPHIGSASREARIAMGMMLLDGYEAIRNGGVAQNRVA